MSIKVKAQKDYLLTEVSIDGTANLAELDAIMKSSKATGKIVVTYNGGGVLGINVEQKTRASDGESAQVRSLLGVETREL